MGIDINLLFILWIIYAKETKFSESSGEFKSEVELNKTFDSDLFTK